jgi:hypothetical protein
LNKAETLGYSRGMFILPYSPRWLAMQGRHQEGRATLLKLHGGRRNARIGAVEAEYAEILTQIEWGLLQYLL